MLRQIGANYLGNNRCRFTVWAPEKERMILHIVSPEDRKVEMNKDDEGYFIAEIDDTAPGCWYLYQPDSQNEFPDPASFSQPQGVHGPSEVIDHAGYVWHDQQWRGVSFNEFVIYELHVGTFTPEGTFESIIPMLDDIAETGINAIEIMPVSQFPGGRNWGYDGAYPYAAQNTYGGPQGLKKLVDACHAKGIAVVLDVVYNHLGPEGSYLQEYGPYFTKEYATPWGSAINYDGAYCDGVRNYFCNNAIYWLKHFHIDALRLDAIHQMYDFGAYHFWNMLHDNVKNEAERSGQHFHLIAESDLNNPKVITHPDAGGHGFNAQWLDDFHHALYVLIDKEGVKRYGDFGSISQLAKAYTDGFVHSGEYVRFRKKNFGASSAGIPGNRFIAFNQNHDQVGNRVDGARLSVMVDFKLLKVAAAALLLAPYIPMLFMGEEYGEDTPFPYFISHTDQQLIDAVKKGRRKEFEHDLGDKEFPDPQSEETFNMAKIDWSKRKSGKYNTLLRWNKALLALRKSNAALTNFDKNSVRVYIINDSSYALHRHSDNGKQALLAIFNLADKHTTWQPLVFTNCWKKILDAADYVVSGTNGADASFATAIGTAELHIPPLSVAVYSAHDHPIDC